MTPGGLACLWEQMCHPLATVVPFPQWPCGRRWASCGLKMIPHLTSSHVGCQEGASLWGRGRGRGGRQGGSEQYTYLQDQYLPKFLLGSHHLLLLCTKSRSCWNEIGWSPLKILLTPPPTSTNIMLENWSCYHGIKVQHRLFIYLSSDSSLKPKQLIMNILKARRAGYNFLYYF